MIRVLTTPIAIPLNPALMGNWRKPNTSPQNFADWRDPRELWPGWIPGTEKDVDPWN